MKAVKALILGALVGISMSAAAQYSQLGKTYDFMMKVEASYAPFMGNAGTPGDYGFHIDKFHNMADVNLMAGVNISQDWFVGGGLGVAYFHNFKHEEVTPYLGANVFIDFDFRPIWKAVMGLDYQPRSIKWAPEVGARAGGAILLGDENTYGTTFSPMAEVYLGANWYYWYAINGMRNMERNWHSFYLTIGVAYMHQAIFLPVRLGWRW